MNIKLTDNEVRQIKEYSDLLDNLTMDTPMEKLTELQSLIATRIAAKVKVTEVFKKVMSE